MAGPNLEVFKFGVYMFFPVWIMFKFGDPQWYQDYVLPYKHTLWPAYEKTNRPPRTLSDIDAELARYKAERAAKKVQQQFEGAAAASSSPPSADGPGGAGTGGQSAIATTTSAFYGRRAAGEGVAGTTVLAGNDGERMV